MVISQGIILITIFIIYHNLYPSFDSGEDHHEHDSHDDQNTLHLGYEPGDDYDDHIHHSLLPCFDPGDDHRS